MTTTIEELYNGQVILKVKFKEKDLDYTVEMFDIITKVYGNRFKPDCKITHFGYNHWFRTQMGLSNTKKYKSVGSLMSAIRKTAKGRNLTVEYFKTECETLLKD